MTIVRYKSLVESFQKKTSMNKLKEQIAIVATCLAATHLRHFSLWNDYDRTSVLTNCHYTICFIHTQSSNLILPLEKECNFSLPEYKIFAFVVIWFQVIFHPNLFSYLNFFLFEIDKDGMTTKWYNMFQLVLNIYKFKVGSKKFRHLLYLQKVIVKLDRCQRLHFQGNPKGAVRVTHWPNYRSSVQKKFKCNAVVCSYI